MQDRAVVTMPLSPTRSSQFARFVSPIVGETISRGISGNFHLCINMLDSFNNRYDDLSVYLDRISKHGIIYDNLWIDKDQIDKLLFNIDELIRLGYIYEKNTEIYRCDCGVIELEKKNLVTINPDKKEYNEHFGNLICKKCNCVCNLYKEKVLIFDPSRLGNPDLRFYPNFLNSDIKTFEKTILSSYSVISRNRNTGIIINYNGNKYNIDIDFVWEVYLSTFKEKEKVVLCGNKEVYQLYMVGIIERCLNKTAKSLFIGTPIINNINENYYNSDADNDILTKKLAVIFNITWRAKVKNFDVDLLDKLKRIPYERKLMMYNIICNPKTTSDEFYEMMQSVLRMQFNYQEVMKVLKRQR